MLHQASPPSRERRTRRFPSDVGGQDLALLLTLVAVFLLMVGVALVVLGVVPVPAI